MSRHVCAFTVAALLSLRFAAPIAHAADSGAARGTSGPPPPAVVTGTENAPAVAAGLSIGATAAGAAAVTAAIYFDGHGSRTASDWAAVTGVALLLAGPSAGHLYTGHYGRAAAYTLGRAVLTAVAFYAFTAALPTESTADDESHGGAWLLLATAATAEVALTIIEPISAYRAARATRGRARPEPPSLSLSPALMPAGGGAPTAGMLLSGRF